MTKEGGSGITDEGDNPNDDTAALDKDDADIAWQEVDEEDEDLASNQRPSNVPASRAAPAKIIDLINYNDEELPVWSKELHHYSDHAQRTVSLSLSLEPPSRAPKRPARNRPR